MKHTRRPRRKRATPPQQQWSVERFVPVALMSGGLALMLTAGTVAFGVAEPVRQNRVDQAATRGSDEQIAAKLTVSSQAFPMAYGCTYPYPYPYPYASCPQADLLLIKDADHSQVELEPAGAGGARRIRGAAIRPAAVSEGFEYDVFVKNMGPDQATNVVMVDSLPPDVVVDQVTPDSPQVTCEIQPPGPGQPTTVVVCHKDALALDDDFEVLIQVRYLEPSGVSPAAIQAAAARSILVNGATVASDEDDPNMDDNTDSADTTVLTPNSLITVPSNLGYWLAASDGGVFSFGNAKFLGSMGGLRLNKPIVGMTGTKSGNGYWLVATDGGIFSFGDATFLGSTGNLALNKPIVGMAATPTGNGYWLVASDGGIFSFGDASFLGSTGGMAINKPIVAMVSTPSGNGYWLFASDGGVFSFGDATFLGSLGAVNLSKPIVGASASGSSTAAGYYLVATDGGIFNFGNAPFLGALGATRLTQSIIAMAALPAQPGGYYLVATDGGVFSYGEAARFLGSLGDRVLAQPIVAIASRVPAVP